MTLKTEQLQETRCRFSFAFVRYSMEEAASSSYLQPIVEGVGNEVLFALPLLCLFLLAGLYLLIDRQFAFPGGNPEPENPQNLTPDQLRDQFLAGSPRFWVGFFFLVDDGDECRLKMLLTIIMTLLTMIRNVVDDHYDVGVVDDVSW